MLQQTHQATGKTSTSLQYTVTLLFLGSFISNLPELVMLSVSHCLLAPLARAKGTKQR